MEKIGIKKAKEVAETADLIIAIFDITKKLNEEDKKILDIIGNKKSIIVLNKIDLVDKVNIPEEILKYKNIIEMSALNKQGIEEMYNKIAELFKFNDIEEDNSFIITNIRHKELIKKAKKNIEDAINTLKNNLPIDIISINIKDALEYLGNITGENVSESIINEIFKKFCLGK